MTLTGLGPIFYPPLISILLAVYGVTGCVIILAGISAHIFVAASILQPVKRHVKEGQEPESDIRHIPIEGTGPSISVGKFARRL